VPGSTAFEAGTQVTPGSNCGVGTKLCNGTCVATAVPDFGCGAASCAPCSIREGAAACSNNACVIASCITPKSDCDGNVENGCETNIRTSAEHCGDCSNRCGASEVCSAGVCKGSCDANLVKCGTSCVDTKTDAEHCGSCPTACTPPTNGAAICAAGACKTQCNAGFTPCAAGCCSAGPGGTEITAVRDRIAAGFDHTCALNRAGSAKCWGDNSVGQIAEPTLLFPGSSTPETIRDLGPTVTAITGTYRHICVLTSAGAVKCWGSNDFGQAGGSARPYRDTPNSVANLTQSISAIAAGQYHTCALTKAGGVKCWGRNTQGQLGNNSSTDSDVPVDVSGLQDGAGVTAIAAGGTHSCALLSNGAVTCWGSDLSSSRVPVLVQGVGAPVASISAGESHSCAVTTTGASKCWGLNGFGQLGDGTVRESPTAVDVRGQATGIVLAVAGGFHSCSLSNVGAVQCWGQGTQGQLGNPVPDDSRTPIDVAMLSPGMVGLTAGWYHTCVLTGAGGAKCWGYNPNGQLGNGTKTGSLVPVDVKGL
jgi:alpha-tubulin suppressor-like RCC1 family protein